MATQFEEAALKRAQEAKERIAAERAAERAKQVQTTTAGAAPAAPVAPAAAPAAPEAPAVPPGYAVFNGKQYLTLTGLVSGDAWKNASHSAKQEMFKAWKGAQFDPFIKAIGDKKTGNPEVAKAQNQFLTNWTRVNLADPAKKDSLLDNDLIDIPYTALTGAVGGVLRVAGDAFGGKSLKEAGLGLQQYTKEYTDRNLSETTKDKALQEGERATRRLHAAMLDSPEFAQKHFKELSAIAKRYGGDITKIPAADTALQALTQKFDQEVGLGVWDSAAGAASDFAKQPLNKTLSAIGASVPALVAGAIGGTAAPIVGTIAGVAAGAALMAGEATSDYDKLAALSHDDMMRVSPEYAAKLARGPDTEERRMAIHEELATDAQNKGAAGRFALGVVTGGLGRKVGLDAVASGAAAKTGAIKHVLGEAAQEGAEGGAGQAIGNAAVAGVDTTQRLGAGVVAAGVGESLAGGMMGGAGALVGNRGGRVLPAAQAATAAVAPVATAAYDKVTGAVPAAAEAPADPVAGANAALAPLNAQADAQEAVLAQTEQNFAPAAFEAQMEGMAAAGAEAEVAQNAALDAQIPLAPLGTATVETPLVNPMIAVAQTAQRDTEAAIAAAREYVGQQDYDTALNSLTADLGGGSIHTPLASQPGMFDYLAKITPEEWAKAPDVSSPTFASGQDAVAAIASAAESHPTLTAALPQLLPLAETFDGQPTTDSGNGAAGAADGTADAAGAGNGDAGAGRQAPDAAEGGDRAAAGKEPAGPARAEPGDAVVGEGTGDADGGRAQPAPDSAVAADGAPDSPVREGGGAQGTASPAAKRGQRGRATPAGGAQDGAAQPDLARQVQPSQPSSQPAGGNRAAGAAAVAAPPPPAAPARATARKPRGGAAKVAADLTPSLLAPAASTAPAPEAAAPTAKPDPADLFRTPEKRRATAAATKAAPAAPAPAPAPATTSSTVKFTPDVTPDVRGVVAGWTKLLGLDNLNLTIGSMSAAKMPQAAEGLISHKADGSKTVLFKRQMSDRKTLEVVAHELGHALQQHTFESAPAETKAAIKAAHEAWLDKYADATDAQLVKALRPYGNGRAGSAVGTLTAEQRAYAKSFNEWFADNVAKWATSAEKPRGVVEQFFSDLGAKLRTFFQSAPEMHKPDVTLAAWLDTLGAKGVGEAAAQTDTEFSQSLGADPASEPAQVARDMAEASRVPASVGAALDWAADKWRASDRARTVDQYRAQAGTGRAPSRNTFNASRLAAGVLDTFVDTGIKVETAFTGEVTRAKQDAQRILDKTGATGALRAQFQARLDSAVAALETSSDRIVLEMRLWHNKADAFFQQNDNIVKGVERTIRETTPAGVSAQAWRFRTNLYAQAVHILERHKLKQESLQRAVNVAEMAKGLPEFIKGLDGFQDGNYYDTLVGHASKLQTQLGNALDNRSLSARQKALEELHAEAVAMGKALNVVLAKAPGKAAADPLRRLVKEQQRALADIKPSNALRAVNDLMAAAQGLSKLAGTVDKLDANLKAAQAEQQQYERANEADPRREKNERGEDVDVFDYPMPGGVRQQDAQATVDAARADANFAGIEAVQAKLVDGFRALNSLAADNKVISAQQLTELSSGPYKNYVSLMGDSQREVTDLGGSRKRAFIDDAVGATHANQAAMPDENLGHKLKQLSSQVGRWDLDDLLVAHANLNRKDPEQVQAKAANENELQLPTSGIVRLTSDFGSVEDRPKDLFTRSVRRLSNAAPADGSVSDEWLDTSIAIDNTGVSSGMFDTPFIKSEVGRRVAIGTRLYGMMVTRFTAVFAPLNMARDMGERMFNVVGLQGRELTPAQVKQVRVRIVKALADPQMRADIMEYSWKGKAEFVKAHPNSALARLVKAGGLTTMTDYLRNEAQYDKNILNRDKFPGKQFDKVSSVFESWNTMFEVLTPLATFSALQDVAGMDDQKAAGVTSRMFDLRARGTVSPHMSALYTFFAPNAYGASQLWRTLVGGDKDASRRAQKELLVLVAAAGALHMMLRGMDDEDENGNPLMDAQSEQNIDGTFLVPLGGGNYIHVPLPFGGVRLAWVAGVRSARVLAGVDDVWDGTAAVTSELVKSSLPTGVSSESATENPSRFLLKTFTPSVLKTLANLGTGTNFAGTPLTYADRADIYKTDQGQASTPGVYTDIAQGIRSATGGLIDTPPEHVREALGGVLIGPASALIPLLTAGSNAEMGREDNPMRDGVSGAVARTVGAGRLYHEQSDEARHKFLVHKMSEKALALVREVNARVPKAVDKSEKLEDKLERAEEAGMEGSDLALLDAYWSWKSDNESVGRKLSSLRKAGEGRDMDAIREALTESDELMKTFISAGAAQ